MWSAEKNLTCGAKKLRLRRKISGCYRQLLVVHAPTQEEVVDPMRIIAINCDLHRPHIIVINYCNYLV